MHKSLIALAGAAGIGLATLATPGAANAGCYGCAVGAGILGGVAAGAIIGSALAPRYERACYFRSRRVWDTPNRFHYERVRICN